MVLLLLCSYFIHLCLFISFLFFYSPFCAPLSIFFHCCIHYLILPLPIRFNIFPFSWLSLHPLLSILPFIYFHPPFLSFFPSLVPSSCFAFSSPFLSFLLHFFFFHCIILVLFFFSKTSWGNLRFKIDFRISYQGNFLHNIPQAGMLRKRRAIFNDDEIALNIFYSFILPSLNIVVQFACRLIHYIQSF